MKSIFKEFIEIFGSFLLILALMFASFLLIINYNHYNETNRKENINIKENAKYNEYLTILDNSNQNINSVNINSINTSKEKNEATVITNLYNECKIILDKSKISQLKSKSTIEMKDIYIINIILNIIPLF